MKTLTPGHKYELSNFENKEAPGQTLQFIEKEPDIDRAEAAKYSHDKALYDRYINGVTTLRTVNDGTTNEEVLAVIIDRLNFLHAKFPSKENAVAITHIETALLWLNKRTADRLARGVEGKALK